MNLFRLVYERCRSRRENPEEITAFPYSLLGHLCGAVGATLAGLLHIQVPGFRLTTGLFLSVSLWSCTVMSPTLLQVLLGAFAAALDALHFICWCLHVFLCWNSKSGNTSIKTHCCPCFFFLKKSQKNCTYI